MNSTKKSMASRLLSWMGVAVLAGGLSGAAFAQTGITVTKHNLSSSGTGTNHVTGTTTATGTDQICVFCHTPHGSAAGGAPIWNRTLKADTGYYTTYSNTGSSTLDGQILGAVGSTSLACLSCHDGSQAMDAMLNAPGSGNPSVAGYTWTGSKTLTGLPNLGSDLSNDHPIGIQYCGGGITGAAGALGGACNDKDFISGTVTTMSTGDTATLLTKDVNGTPVFWVNTDANTARNKVDLQLYTRTFPGGSGPSVECGSCHDPHMEALATGAVNFMRVTTTGSKICLSCHIK